MACQLAAAGNGGPVDNGYERQRMRFDGMKYANDGAFSGEDSRFLALSEIDSRAERRPLRLHDDYPFMILDRFVTERVQRIQHLLVQSVSLLRSREGQIDYRIASVYRYSSHSGFHLYEFKAETVHQGDFANQSACIA